MSKRNEIPALLASLAVTAAMIGSGFWFVSSRITSIPEGFEQASQGRRDANRQAQFTLLGDTFSGYSTFRNAEFLSALEESGIEINYEDEFDQSRRADALRDGDADLIVTTLDQFIKQKPKGKIIGLLDRTVGADAVVLNTQKYPTLMSLNDLGDLVQQAKASGEKLSIAYAIDTPSEYLALVLDTKFDAFKLSDFEVFAVSDAATAMEMMRSQNRNVVLSILWEPHVTQARQQGYNVVLSSKDAPNAIVDVIVASDKAIKSKPEALSRLLEAYYRRIDANARDATQLQTQVAEDGELSVADASAIIDGIDFFTATEAQNWLTDGTLEKRIGATAAVLTLSNRIGQVPSDPQSLFTAQFVAEAASNTQTLVELVRADNPALADKLSGKRTALAVAPDISAEQIQQAPDIGNLQVRGQVSFSTGSANLTSEGKQTLNQLAQEISEFNSQTTAVRVIGHTSRTGSAAVNQTLSQQRADVVVNHLKGMGVALSILPEGKGFSEPLANIDPTDERNQRTEIRLVRVN